MLKYKKCIGAIHMKHLSKLIVLLLGGLLIMVSLGACGEKIPENRTKEQYELEKEFQPLFDFLAEEKKDLPNVKIYYSSVYITDRKTKTREGRSIRLENPGTEIPGEYKIEDGKNVKRIPVTFQSDKIIYKNNVEESEKYNMDIFNLQLTPKFFSSLSISDYMAKHPETYMKRIDYRVKDNYEFLSHLKKRYGFVEECPTDVNVIINGHGDYELQIEIIDSNKIATITNSIVLDESGNKNAAKSLIGQLMKATKGQANPQVAQKLLNEELEKL
nr:GatB/YqeY domain-containing protein [Streptococcus gordonii]